MNIVSDIKKQFGDDIICDGNAIAQSKNIIIPWGISITAILGGGVPEGSFITLTGAPKAGKTISALHLASICQKPEYGNRDVYYFNVEGRIKQRDIDGIKNLNKDKFHVFSSIKGKILYAEEFLQTAFDIIHNAPDSVIIIDSYSALCTQVESTEGMDKMQRADGAKLLAKFCRKVSNIIPVNKNIVIGITHLMGNPGYGTSEWKEKSGQAIKYQADIRLKALYFKPWTVDDKQICQEVQWQCETSAIGPPGQKATSYIRYGEGIDECRELIEIANSVDIIKKAGSWYSYENIKVQGQEKMRDALLNDKKNYKKLHKEVLSFLCE